MYVLTETSNSSRAINLSLVVNINGHRLLLLAQGATVKVYLYEGTSLAYITTLKLENKLRSWAKFVKNSKTYVILINCEYEVKLMELGDFSSNMKHLDILITHVVKLSTKGQRVSPNLDAPIIIPVREEDPEYILFHIFYSNIQIFTVGDLFSTSKKEILPDTRNIGQIDAKQIVNLTTHDPSQRKTEGNHNNLESYRLAVLYNDITSTSYVRYLDFSERTPTFEVCRQLPPFEEEPCLIQPCIQEPGGLIVYTSSSMFYFPPQQFKHVSARQTKNVFISTKSQDPYFAVTLDKPGRGKNRPVYKCFEPIDLQRTLLTATCGQTFLLYMDLEVSTGSSVVVNQVSFIDLNYTTIPIFNGLHHIQGNHFFQASKTSKLILFEILPMRPNIDILDSIDGNPPVLDLKEANDEGLFACQGGWDGSQLRKYTSPRGRYEEIKLVKVFDGRFKFVGQSEDKFIVGAVSEGDANMKIKAVEKGLLSITVGNNLAENVLEVSKSEKHDVILTQRKLIVNGETTFDGNVEFGVIQANDGVVVIATSDNVLYVHDILQVSNGMVCKIDRYHDNGDEISSVDMFRSRDTSWMICSFLSGKYDVWEINAEQQKLVYLASSDSAIFSSCIFVQGQSKSEESNSVHLFFLHTNGDVCQVKLKKVDNVLTLDGSSTANVCDLPYVWRRHGNRILGFNSKGLIVPKRLRELDQYGFAKIDKPNVIDIRFDNNMKTNSSQRTSSAIVCLEDGSIEKWEIEIGELAQLNDFSSFYSNKLFVKCLPIPGTKYVVVVAYDNSISLGEIKTELLLVDASTLELYDVFKFHDDTEVVDLSGMTKEQFAPLKLDPFVGFICLSAGGKLPITFFKIIRDKLKLFERSTISGVKMIDEVKFGSITYYPGSNWGNYSITGTINFFCNLCPKKGARLDAIDESIESASSFGLALTITSSRYMIADVLTGVWQFEKKFLEPYRANVIPNTADRYLTCMSHTSGRGVADYYVVGYSSGTVAIFNPASYSVQREMVRFVIEGDQINAITGSNGDEDDVSRTARIGTLSGGIFTLNRIIDKSWEQVIRNCEKELKLYAREKGISTVKVIELSGTDSLPYHRIGVIDGNVLFQFLGDENIEDDKFRALVANKRTLQRIYSRCCA